MRWATVCARSPGSDLMSGAAGALLAGAEIEALCAGALPGRLVRALHEATSRAAATMLDGGEPALLGLAHGLAGSLLALEASTTLCCGQTGRAHVLVEAYRQGGDARWLACAEDLARRDLDVRPALARTLHHGRLGVDFLRLRLHDPAAPQPQRMRRCGV